MRADMSIRICLEIFGPRFNPGLYSFNQKRHGFASLDILDI